MIEYSTPGEQINYQANAPLYGEISDPTEAYVPNKENSCESGVLNSVSTTRILP